MRHLRRAVDNQLPKAWIPLSHDAAPLQRGHALARRPQTSPHTDCCTFADLSKGFPRMRADGGFEKDIILPMLVHQRCTKFARGEHVYHRRKLVEIDGNLCRQVLGFGAGVGHAHGDHLTHQTHLVAGQNCLLRRLEARKARISAYGPDTHEIGEHKNAVLTSVRLVNFTDIRMRDRAARERHIPHADHANIADVLAKPAQEAIVFFARQGCPDAAAGKI